MKGYTDKPVDSVVNDTFGVGNYIDGLCNFILNCDTPMTISIQGDWGSGKTSMMNMVKNKIEKDVIAIWFNTWQFSQFGMEDNLSLCLFTNMLKELSYDNDKLNSITRALGNIGKAAGVVATEKLLGGVTAGQLSDAFSNSSIQDSAEELKNLKFKFQEAVGAKLKSLGKERVVVFVDDLDRLQPEKAVELLEALKIFLDCENCIYVLAVDYSVVSQGIRKKFGDNVDAKKGRSFFDKIIQLPFKMPVEQYDINQYISDMLKKINMEASDSDLNAYVELIKYSIGCNPRSMKRLFNSYLLLNSIVDISRPKSESEDKTESNKILFAILCMQMAFEDLYKFLAGRREFIEIDLLEELTSYESITSTEDFQELIKSMDEEELRQSAIFMKKFIKAISRENKIEDSQLNLLKSLLFFANMTAVSDQKMETSVNTEEDFSLRYLYKDVANKLILHISKTYDKVFKIYQPRKPNKNESIYISDTWIYIYSEKDSVNFSFEIRIKKDNKSDATIITAFIFPRKKSSFEDLKNIIGDNPLELTLTSNNNDFTYENIVKSEANTADEIFGDVICDIDKIMVKIISIV